MEKLKQILDKLSECEKLAQKAVDAEEHYMLPVLRHVQAGVQATQARINQLQSWANEQQASADAAKKAEAAAPAAQGGTAPVETVPAAATPAGEAVEANQ